MCTSWTLLQGPFPLLQNAFVLVLRPFSSAQGLLAFMRTRAIKPLLLRSTFGWQEVEREWFPLSSGEKGEKLVRIIWEEETPLLEEWEDQSGEELFGERWKFGKEGSDLELLLLKCYSLCLHHTRGTRFFLYQSRWSLKSSFLCSLNDRLGILARKPQQIWEYRLHHAKSRGAWASCCA